MRRERALLVAFGLAVVVAVANPADAASPPAPSDPVMARVLAGGGPALRAVLAAPAKYRFQILYGVVTPEADPSKPPTLARHGYRADAEYFFPASSMKMPIALAMYTRMAAGRKNGKPWLDRDARLAIYPASATGSANAEPFATSIARETWRALIVSDNRSANRLLAFVGHREVHETLWSLGLASVRLHTGFATGEALEPAEVSPRFEMTMPGVKPEEIAPRRSTLVLPPTNASGIAVGKAAIVDGKLVRGPLSFADKNAMRLRDLQDTLVRIMRPELVPPSRGAAHEVDPEEEKDLAYLRQTLGTLPSESGLAGFDRNVVADYPLCPFLRGLERVKPRAELKIYSKVGQAFGFLIANAYIVDNATGRGFFLAASIYANPDEIVNSDRYAYDAVSFPVLADVAEVFAREAFAAPAAPPADAPPSDSPPPTRAE